MIVVLTVTVDRIAGKFAPFDDVAEALRDAIQDAYLDGLGSDGDSEYEVQDVETASGSQVRDAVRAAIAHDRLTRHRQAARR